jgi:hypothetical protein
VFSSGSLTSFADEKMGTARTATINLELIQMTIRSTFVTLTSIQLASGGLLA